MGQMITMEGRRRKGEEKSTLWGRTEQRYLQILNELGKCFFQYLIACSNCSDTNEQSDAYMDSINEGENNMRACYTEEAIMQNLEDAGCNAEMIECFMKKFRAHNRTDSLKLLEMQRRKLLDNLHREQRCIDCLDYLVHDIEKSEHI